jgi:hypothetical protein
MSIGPNDPDMGKVMDMLGLTKNIPKCPSPKSPDGFHYFVLDKKKSRSGLDVRKCNYCDQVVEEKVPRDEDEIW